MTLSELQENIAKLFLRLNGYFANSLIIHSDEKGKNKTQIDLIAVRFPYHDQTDRVVGSSEYLQIPEGKIDIIIAEVKSGKEKNQFNSALRDDADSIQKLLKWIGIVPTEKIDTISKWLIDELRPKEVNKLTDFPNFDQDNIYSIRPMVFNLDCSKPRDNQKRFVYGELILNYIWECFRPEEDRLTCSITYPLNLWGHDLTPIVEYFKDKEKVSAGSIDDIYKHFGFV